MIETTILSSLIHDENYSRRVLPYLRVDYFQQPQQQVVFSLVKEHILKYNSIPSQQSLLIDLEQKQVPEAVHEKTVQLLNSLKPIQSDEQWLVDSTEEFCKRQALYNAILKSADMIEKKDTANFGQMLDLVQQALSVSFNSHIGHDFIEDAEKRFEFYHQQQSKLPVDIKVWNEILKGGFNDKTMTCFAAPTGVGKSLVLCHLASAFMLAGLDVLYITLEMSEERISERVDANVLDVPILDLPELEKSGYFKRISRLRTQTIGKLIVQEYPQGTAHVGHFRHLLHELSLKKQFKPKILIVDYLNICASLRMTRGSNSHDYVKSIAEELRSLCTEFDLRLFTATQINREGTKNGDFEITDTSESWGVPQTVDYMYGLVSSPEMEQLGQIKIKRFKDRYNDVFRPRAFVVGIDRSKMRLFDVNQDEVVNTPTETVNEQKSKFAKLIV